MKFTTWFGEGHGVQANVVPYEEVAGSLLGQNIPEGATQFSSDRVDPEPVFMKWLFSRNRNSSGDGSGGSDFSPDESK